MHVGIGCATDRSGAFSTIRADTVMLSVYTISQEKGNGCLLNILGAYLFWHKPMAVVSRDPILLVSYFAVGQPLGGCPTLYGCPLCDPLGIAPPEISPSGRGTMKKDRAVEIHSPVFCISGELTSYRDACGTCTPPASPSCSRAWSGTRGRSGRRPCVP